MIWDLKLRIYGWLVCNSSFGKLFECFAKYLHHRDTGWKLILTRFYKYFGKLLKSVVYFWYQITFKVLSKTVQKFRVYKEVKTFRHLSLVSNFKKLFDFQGKLFHIA